MKIKMKDKSIGWFFNGTKVIENDGFFVRLSNGFVYAWTKDGNLI
mgnify:CR=1 FL=1